MTTWKKEQDDTALLQPVPTKEEDEKEEEEVVHDKSDVNPISALQEIYNPLKEYDDDTTAAADDDGIGPLSLLLQLSLWAVIARWILLPTWVWMVDNSAAAVMQASSTTTITTIRLDYFIEPMCPMIQHIRRRLFQWDPSIYSVINGLPDPVM